MLIKLTLLIGGYMGIKERRDAEKSEMRKRIMDAATEIINQEGYEKLSIRKIASKIEYSPTTIYLYYKDKAEIVRDMSDTLYRKVSLTAAGLNESSVPVDRRIRGMLCVFIKELCGEPEMARAIMSSDSSVIFANDSGGERPSNPGIDLLDALILEGIADNIFRAGAENTSWMLVSAVLGFVLTSISNKLYGHKKFDCFVNDFVEILMNGINQNNNGKERE